MNINILMGIDDSRRLAHVIHINCLTGVIRSVAGSYKDSATLDLWRSYERNALYSDYEVFVDETSKERCFLIDATPSYSLVEHDVTVDDSVNWLSALRMLVATESRIAVHGSHKLMSGLRDSNSSLSLVMNYEHEGMFYAKRMSGVDCEGTVLDTSGFEFYTPLTCQGPFSSIIKGEPADLTIVPETSSDESDSILVQYNKVKFSSMPHFRELPSVMTDAYFLSKLVMIRDALNMVSDLLAVQIFTPREVRRRDSVKSDYESLGSVTIKSSKYPDLKKAALSFMEELQHLLKNPDAESYLADEPVFDFFCQSYRSALESPKHFYFQYRKIQSLLSILLMECKLNMFYTPSLHDVRAVGKPIYGLKIGIGGRP